MTVLGPRRGDDRAGAAAEPSGAQQAPVLAVFASLWALAAVLHALGNPGIAPDWATAVLCLAAAAVLAAPGRLAALGLLAMVQLGTVWLEAPMLGNHWLLVGMVNLALLGALLAGRRDAAAVTARFLPVARLVLLGFYAFAAFSKLNEDFLSPAVSCAPFFMRESATSIGLGGLPGLYADAVERAVIWGTLAVELSLPALLVWRRTRHAAVVLGLVFHALLAVDRTHQFYDFSSVLFALFLLFLPAVAASDLVARARGVAGARHARRVAAGAAAALGLLAASDLLTRRQLLDVGWLVWWPAAAAVIAGTVIVLRSRRPAPLDRPFALPAPWLAAVPALAVFNGLTPYLELKTAYGWNMYSNLRTVAGETNHLVVPATLPLTDVNERLVRIVDSSAPGLEYYADRGYLLPLRNLRSYVALRPDVSVTYEVDGRRRSAVRAGADPLLAGAPPRWLEKVSLFRAVDPRPRARCLDVFGPAR